MFKVALNYCLEQFLHNHHADLKVGIQSRMMSWFFVV